MLRIATLFLFLLGCAEPFETDTDTDPACPVEPAACCGEEIDDIDQCAAGYRRGWQDCEAGAYNPGPIPNSYQTGYLWAFEDCSP